MPQLTMPGGLWEESFGLYRYAGAKANGTMHSWTFPTGASVTFGSMELEQDKYKYDGSQIALIQFDQLESFSAGQFFYMLSRNRSMCGSPSYVRASANPLPGWLADFLQWWWDEKTGYVIPERSGKVRFFVRPGDTVVWSDSKEDLQRRFPDFAEYVKSVTFIASSLDDNPKMLERNPGYKASLMSMQRVDRERLLKGNWKITVAGNIFKREWWKYVDKVPGDAKVVKTVRYWDKAATPPEDAKGRVPDWTSGARLCRAADGRVFVEHVNRFQGSPLQNEKSIKSQAELDSRTVYIGMEQEPGASGKSDVDYYKRIILFGFMVLGVAVHKNKVLRWGPLSAAAENGNVYLVRGPWNQAFVDELEACRGEDEKNDQADSAAGAFTMLADPKAGIASASQLRTGKQGPDEGPGIEFEKLDL